MKKLFPIILFCITKLFGQQLNVGDTLPLGFGLPWCGNSPEENPFVIDSFYLDLYNGNINESGQHYVIWINLFTSWCPYCQVEAPYTEGYLQEYIDDGLAVVGIGWDWGLPEDCKGWAEYYELTYPILDDAIDGTAFEMLGAGGVPYNVVLNHDMEIVYSMAGFPNEGAPIFNAISDALDSCGVKCLPGCSGVVGEINGTFSFDGQPIINIMDLLMLSDKIMTNEVDECVSFTGDINSDNNVNLLDIITLANNIINNVY